MLQTLLDQGLDYHDSESQRLAGELEAAADEASVDQLEPLLKLANHTIGEHLGDWGRARRLAERVMAGRAATPASSAAFARLAVARLQRAARRRGADRRRRRRDPVRQPLRRHPHGG